MRLLHGTSESIVTRLTRTLVKTFSNMTKTSHRKKSGQIEAKVAGVSYCHTSHERRQTHQTVYCRS